MRHRGLSFAEAVPLVADLSGLVTGPRTRSLDRQRTRNSAVADAPRSAVADASGSGSEALALVTAAEKRLWTPGGTEALAYLRGRGLRDATIQAARLGYVASVWIPTRDGDRYYQARGVVIPWFEDDRLALVKIRQPEGTKPKCAEAFRDRPRIFPGPEIIQRGRPLVVVEGEFDALLLGQELHDLAAVVTLGSASSTPEPTTCEELALAAPCFLALDGDAAGERSTAGWPARAIRVRPPGSFKDLTEAASAGVDLRRFWSDRLGRCLGS